MSKSKQLSNNLEKLVELGEWMQSNNWCPATSGNVSTKVDGDSSYWISISGKYKGELARCDFIEIDESGQSLSKDKEPSAETLLHGVIYQQFPSTQFVLHTHSVYGTVLSQYQQSGSLQLTGYELQKAFAGTNTHKGELSIPVFENNQDMRVLSVDVSNHIKECGRVHGFLLAGHGLYAWGADAVSAKRHLEALEFLFECEYKLRLFKTGN